jgi:hypothetical protein
MADKDQRQLAFFLYRDTTYDEISCVGSIRFDTSMKWKRGDKVVLFGKWEHNLVSGQPLPLFIFNSAVRQAA